MSRKEMFLKKNNITSIYTVANAVYTGNSFSIQTWNYRSDDLILKPDGSKIYWLGIISFQLNMSTNFNISTSSFVGSYNQRTQTGNGNPFSVTMAFNNDGTKLFIHSEINDKIFQYNLSTAYLITSSSYSGNSISISTNLTKMLFSSDGYKLYLSYTSGILYEYDLSIAYDITTWVYNSISGNIGDCKGFQFAPDGLRIFVLTSNLVKEYDLSSPFEISTAFYNGVSYTISQGGDRASIVINNDFTKMYIGNSQTDYKIYEYNL